MIRKIRVHNYRSIADSEVLPLGRITLIVGRNNSGKSALLRALYLLQQGAPFNTSDVRIDARGMQIYYAIDPRFERYFSRTPSTREEPFQPDWSIKCEVSPGGTIALWRHGKAGLHAGTTPAPGQEPRNLIYPILSGRRQSSYEEQVRRDSAMAVLPNDNNLVARVSSLATAQIPEAEKFRRLCRRVLGVDLSVLAGQNGQTLGIQVNRFNGVPLEAMGTGISSALNLLVSLSGAKSKLFLIEEPENDLHPQAVRALLDAIVEADNTNQFIITTHSSVVLAQLGALPDSVILHAKNKAGLLPTSEYQVVDTPLGRLEILHDLGYELADLDLSEGWIIFEESSAERLTRQWLIPWFAPKLARLRTIAASGVSRVEPLMQDFKELFLFAHREPLYRGRAWVFVDGDDIGKKVIAELTEQFPDWPSSRFQSWDRPAFEEYYPAEFSEKAIQVLQISDKRKRREAKRSLLHEVLAWIDEDPQRARAAFEESAADVISRLRSIEPEASRLSLLPLTVDPATSEDRRLS